jgi:hypothetical protein
LFLPKCDNLIIISCVEPKATDFIPLKDLLKKNHGDRVQDYMSKMKHMTADEIVNSRASLEEKTSQGGQTGGISQRQKTIVNNAHQRPRGKLDFLKLN